MRSLIGKLRHLRIDPLIVEQKVFYGGPRTPDSIKKWQLERFNEEWKEISRHVPYFHELKLRESFPDGFRDWEEFKDRIPVLDRKMLQEETNRQTSRAGRTDFFRTTGGSTAEPVQIPAWRSEGKVSVQDLWYARSWFGIKPSDKLFLIWGHRHLLGNGLGGWWNGVKRQGKDRLLGYHRFSAYDLSDKKMALAAEKLLEFRPSYLLGYSVALDRFARVNYNNRSVFHKLGLKAAIATAESFPSLDSQGLIGEVLGCPVAMEYGAVETGPLAHQRPDGVYSIFWRHFFLEGRSSKYFPGRYEILVTTLYPRSVPLVRYRLGDLISEDPNSPSFKQEFETVIGRCNDLITLGNHQVVHSEAFSHVVAEISSITGYQVIQLREGRVRLNYTGPKPLEMEEMKELRRRLDRISPELAGIEIKKAESLTQTIAGKTRRICVEEKIGA